MVDETSNAHASRLRRWRLVLGEPDGTGFDLRDRRDREMDRVLRALYNEAAGDNRKGGLGRSAPSVTRWLDDIRTYFPSSVVQIMQRDAIERLNLRQLLLEPELLQSIEPDVHLVATILALKGCHSGQDQSDRTRCRAPCGRGSGTETGGAGAPDAERQPRPRCPQSASASERDGLAAHDLRQSQTLPAIAAHDHRRRASDSGAGNVAVCCAKSCCASTRAVRWRPQ